MLAARFLKLDIPESLKVQIQSRIDLLLKAEQESKRVIDLAERKPYFCSGCPHNSSTVVPEGSRALGGIGCHYIAVSLDRGTETFSQMGGEGVSWVGASPLPMKNTFLLTLVMGLTSTQVTWQFVNLSPQKPISPTKSFTTTQSL